ncbi:MAG: DMT family transporter [Sphingomonadales bacterium]
MGLIEWVFLFSLALLWGTAFAMTVIGLGELPPFTLAFGRIFVAALTLLALIRLFGTRLPRGGEAWRAIITSAFIGNAIPFSLIAWGQQHIPSSLSGVLMATAPLFTLVIAHFSTVDERMTGAKAAALLLGFVAVVVLVGPDALGGVASSVTGQLALLGAAFCYAGASVYGRRFRTMNLKPLPLAGAQLSAASVMMVPVVLALEQPWLIAMPSITGWLAVMELGVVATALPYIIYFRVLAVGGATNLMLVTFMVPVVAVTTGALMLGEMLEVRHFVATGILILSLAAIDGRIFKWWRSA